MLGLRGVTVMRWNPFACRRSLRVDRGGCQTLRGEVFPIFPGGLPAGLSKRARWNPGISIGAKNDRLTQAMRLVGWRVENMRAVPPGPIRGTIRVGMEKSEFRAGPARRSFGQKPEQRVPGIGVIGM